jgi:hypothetical protein
MGAEGEKVGPHHAAAESEDLHEEPGIAQRRQARILLLQQEPDIHEPLLSPVKGTN